MNRRGVGRLIFKYKAVSKCPGVSCTLVIQKKRQQQQQRQQKMNAFFLLVR